MGVGWGWGIPVHAPVIHSKSLGRFLEFIVTLPNKSLLTPTLLGKVAFARDENINIQGLEAQKW